MKPLELLRKYVIHSKVVCESQTTFIHQVISRHLLRLSSRDCLVCAVFTSGRYQILTDIKFWQISNFDRYQILTDFIKFWCLMFGEVNYSLDPLWWELFETFWGFCKLVCFNLHSQIRHSQTPQSWTPRCWWTGARFGGGQSPSADAS